MKPSSPIITSTSIYGLSSGDTPRAREGHTGPAEPEPATTTRRWGALPGLVALVGLLAMLGAGANTWASDPIYVPVEQVTGDHAGGDHQDQSAPKILDRQGFFSAGHQVPLIIDGVKPGQQRGASSGPSQLSHPERAAAPPATLGEICQGAVQMVHLLSGMGLTVSLGANCRGVVTQPGAQQAPSPSPESRHRAVNMWLTAENLTLRGLDQIGLLTANASLTATMEAHRESQAPDPIPDPDLDDEDRIQAENDPAQQAPPVAPDHDGDYGQEHPEDRRAATTVTFQATGTGYGRTKEEASREALKSAGEVMAIQLIGELPAPMPSIPKLVPPNARATAERPLLRLKNVQHVREVESVLATMMTRYQVALVSARPSELIFAFQAGVGGPGYHVSSDLAASARRDNLPPAGDCAPGGTEGDPDGADPLNETPDPPEDQVAALDCGPDMAELLNSTRFHGFRVQVQPQDLGEKDESASQEQALHEWVATVVR